jgi:ribosomal protein L14E/L6E/L27E
MKEPFSFERGRVVESTQGRDRGKTFLVLEQCGEDLVIAATEMPDVRCRFMAVNAASDWCLARNCRLPELSPALAQAMERMKAAETNERVKQRLAESGF